MRLPRHDPRFAGLRFLHVPETLGLSAQRSAGLSGGGKATAFNATALDRGPGGPTFSYAYGSGGLVFNPPAEYGGKGGSLTLIYRQVYAGSVGTAGLHQLVESATGAASNGAGDTTSSFAAYLVIDGFTDVGLHFGVFYGGNYWYRNALSVSMFGRDLVVAGVHDREAKSLALYADGVRIDTQDITNITPSTFDFVDVWSGATNWTIAKNAEAKIGFVAAFDRALSPAELSWWGKESNWLPLLTEDEDWCLTDGTVLGRNVVGVGVYGSSSPPGGVRGRTAVDLSLSVGGDLSVEPAPASTVTGVNRVGVTVRAAAGPPELVRGVNRVGVRVTGTGSGPFTGTNRVGVRVRGRGLLDGRVNLLDGSRYRR